MQLRTPDKMRNRERCLVVQIQRGSGEPYNLVNMHVRPGDLVEQKDAFFADVTAFVVKLGRDMCYLGDWNCEPTELSIAPYLAAGALVLPEDDEAVL